MRGSIAVWHDTLTDSARGYSPRIEVHINIWKANKLKNEPHNHLLDIGLKFEEIRSLRTLSICLPFVTQADNVSDLFELMHSSRTLSAIFNETLSAGEYQDDGNTFTARDEKKRVQFYVAQCKESDRSLQTIEDESGPSSIIMLKDSFFDRLRSRVGDQYCRLRILVPFNTPNAFISEVYPEESPFLSTISTNEVVEFRLNDRRNFSKQIRDRLDGSSDLVSVSSVHYLLIRDMNVELTQAHTSFKKMRRLEPEIWSEYLRGQSQIFPEKMIIYHWNVTAKPDDSVESFTALATFRSYYTGYLWVYAVVIIALGAMGSALQASLAPALAALGPTLGLGDGFSSFLANVVILTFLGSILLTIVWISRGAARRGVR